MKTIDEMAQENFGKFLEDGPRLRCDYNVWVQARDRTKKLVLLGGLGGMGVGEMWFKDTGRYKKYAGYKNAPEAKGFLFEDFLSETK